MTRNLDSDEFPDGFEYQHADTYKGFAEGNMMVLEPLLNQTDWYNNSIFPYAYKEYTLEQLNNKEIRYYHFPPDNAMTIFNAYLIQHQDLTDNEIASNSATGLPQIGSIGYYVVYQCDRDQQTFRSLKTRLTA